MKIVIQCAASKVPNAGSLTDTNGKPVLFVVNPALAPRSETCIYARPDDPLGNGLTLREVLLEYNKEYKHTGANCLRLLPAYRLYGLQIYRQLVDHFGVSNVFVLSAGWGLISADFLTPKYDITFSTRTEKYRIRLKRDWYNDFQLLPDDDNEEIVFFGGKDYVALFCNLTREYRGRRFIFYNSGSPPAAPGCRLIRYPTTIRTNWHYACAKDFMNGQISYCPEA